MTSTGPLPLVGRARSGHVHSVPITSMIVMNIAATYTTLTATFWLTRLVMLVLPPLDPPKRKAVLDVATTAHASGPAVPTPVKARGGRFSSVPRPGRARPKPDRQR